MGSKPRLFCPWTSYDQLERCWLYDHQETGQWIESVTDWAIRITDWCLFPDWVSSHARLADPIRPMLDNGNFEHFRFPIALISRLPDWVVQSVLPIAIHRLLHRFYPLARPGFRAENREAISLCFMISGEPGLKMQ